jgi:hypothetical protein
MKKKQKPFILEPFIEFMTDRITAPTKKEIDKLIRKTEQSLSSLKVPTKAEFERLTQRVEALEKALKVGKGAKKAARPQRPGKKAAAKKKQAARAKAQVTSSDKVLQAIRRYRTGVDVATLKTQTGIEDKKLRDVIFRLSKQGKIKRTGRGVYKAAA